MKDSFDLYQFVCQYNIIIIFTSIMNGRLQPKQVIITVQKLLLFNLYVDKNKQNNENVPYPDQKLLKMSSKHNKLLVYDQLFNLFAPKFF